MRYDIFQSMPAGPLVLAGDQRGLRHLNFLKGTHPLTIGMRWHRDPGFFKPVKEQLTAYLAGVRRRFNIPLNLQGTAFQMQVWSVLRDIPYGAVVSYQWVAKRIGNPAAVRAVGAANGRNPIAIIVPCHRVIGKDGQLTGYGGGLAVKHRLLQLENPELRLGGTTSIRCESRQR